VAAGARRQPLGTLYLSQAAIPHLLETKGIIVNVASNAGLMGQSYAAAYSASKGGLVNLTRELAIEYLKQGIRINAVAPGGTDTNMMQDMSMPEGVDLKILMRNTVPRPNSKPEEIASVIAFLASDEASSVHGAIWSVDNGLTA
jgi:meso-butanediol dehydrogenase/(S,S)-butanediol dehydrogenase/diacetyl reductase